MILKFLGIGSAFNTDLGCSSAYRIISEGKKLQLFDCGEDVFKKIKDMNLLDDIEEIVIYNTHLHSDHVSSLGSLIFYCYYIKNITPKIITGNIESMEMFLRITGCFDFCEISHGDSFIKVKHVPQIDFYGFKLPICDDKYIYYSGDCSEINYEILEDKNCIEYYQDVCYHDYESNPHLNYKQIPIGYKDKIIAYHIDCDELIVELNKLGITMGEMV